MKTKVMRALSIEIGRESYPRWPVPIVRAPVVSVWMAENEVACENTTQHMPRRAPCAHGMLIAAGALECPLLPVVCHHEPTVSMVHV